MFSQILEGRVSLIQGSFGKSFSWVSLTHPPDRCAQQAKIMSEPLVLARKPAQGLAQTGHQELTS